ISGTNRLGQCCAEQGKIVKNKVAIPCACLKSRQNGSGALNRMPCASLKRGSPLALRAVLLKFICHWCLSLCALDHPPQGRAARRDAYALAGFFVCGGAGP